MPFLSLVIRGMGWRLSVPKASPLHWRWGAAMAVLGLALTPLCRGSWTLLLCFGILMPAGLGAFSFGLIMGAVTPLLGEKKASAVSGIINASSGLGSILLALVLRGVLDSFGLWGAIIALCLPMLCLVPVLLLLRKADAKQAESTPPLLRPLLKTAFHDRSYRLLSLAFFTCGFHMAIIETHLYTQFTSYGFTEQSVTYAFSIYGIATMAGSVVSGYLGSRFPMKKVLGGFYASRTLWTVGFLLLPKSPAAMYAFAILLGFTGAATVPPTSGTPGQTPPALCTARPADGSHWRPPPRHSTHPARPAAGCFPAGTVHCRIFRTSFPPAAAFSRKNPSQSGSCTAGRSRR